MIKLNDIHTIHAMRTTSMIISMIFYAYKSGTLGSPDCTIPVPLVQLMYLYTVRRHIDIWPIRPAGHISMKKHINIWNHLDRLQDWMCKRKHTDMYSIYVYHDIQKMGCREFEYGFKSLTIQKSLRSSSLALYRSANVTPHSQTLHLFAGIQRLRRRSQCPL